MQVWREHSRELLGGDPSPRLSELVDALSPGARVLEVGCGGGRNTRYLKRVGVEVVALDVASEPLLLLGGCCDRVRATADFHLPFASSSFDGAVDSYAFTFVVERGLYARELYRVLKPGGLLLLEFDAEPHVREHSELEAEARGAFEGLFEFLYVRRIYHAWGCLYDETREEIPAVAALLTPLKPARPHS